MFSKLLKKLKVPHVFALLTLVILVCAGLTYLIPSGQYERVQKRIGSGTRTVVAPDTYQVIPKHFSLKGFFLDDPVEGKAGPVGLKGFFSAVPRGMEQAADIIFFIFVIGGAFGILQRTGVINATIHKLLDIFGDNGPILTAVIMFTLAAGGSTLGMGEEFIPLVPIFVIVAHRLGYDRLYGMAMVILAAQIGFAAATTNPFTLAVAQGIAEIPLYSGIWFRLVFFIAAWGLTLLYVLRYGAKLKRDPAASLVPPEPAGAEPETEAVTFTKRHGWILFSCLAVFAVVLWGSAGLGWSFVEMAGGFFLMGILAAAIAKLSLNEGAEAFTEGAKDMVVAALVVGFAKGIQVVMEDGLILDTIIYGAADLLKEVPQLVAVQGMFLFQTVLNFFIPSGSGQAAVTMPLMTPLADVLGLTRQTAVFAFQCGDGFSNTVIPTSGILMSMLALARIPYERWLKFMLPLLGQLLLLSALFLCIAVWIGYR